MCMFRYVSRNVEANRQPWVLIPQTLVCNGQAGSGWPAGELQALLVTLVCNRMFGSGWPASELQALL